MCLISLSQINRILFIQFWRLHPKGTHLGITCVFPIAGAFVYTMVRLHTRQMQTNTKKKIQLLQDRNYRVLDAMTPNLCHQKYCQ